jgi:RHS repeat-associated protein
MWQFRVRKPRLNPADISGIWWRGMLLAWRVTRYRGRAGSQSNGYDAVGNMTRSTDGRNNSTVTTFNAWNLPTATIEPSTAQDPNPGQRTFTTSYDRGGLPIQSVEPGNVQLTRSFDAWNQLTAENATQPVPQGPSVQKQFGYDAAGRLARVGSPSGDSTYTYDDRGLLVAAAGVGGTASMAYNERGLPTTRTDSSGTASFGWQPARDQLATVTDSTGGTRSYAWNGFGQLSAESYGTALRQYGYDTAGRLSTDSLKDAGGASLAGFAYSYDVSGNVASKTVNLPGNSQSGVHTYEYDLAERLTKWTINGAATPYQYDAAGNRTQAGTATYTYDARNRLQTGPNETYNYSSRGALRQSTKNGVATTFTVDAAGRTAQSVVAGQAPVNFQYDGLDRVLNRNGAAFTYTGTAMDPTSDGTTTFSRGPDGTPLWLTKAGATVAAGMDRHGDLAFTLNANLTVGSTSVYDPFGAPTVKTGPGAAIGFQADWTEPSTGNVWMGARWYTPGNASFTTRDTYAGNPSTPVSLNRYTYGSNNPIRYSDPTGHYSVEDMGIDFSQYDFSGIGSGAGSSGGGSQTMSNAELYAQYQSTGYIPDDNPINTTTTFNTSSDGSVVVWNPSSGAGGFLGSDGSSMQAVGGVVVSSSAANPAPLVIGGKTYNPEDSFSYQAAGGVEVNCTAAATAAGYGRTCTSSNIDGSVTTTSASGMIGLNAQRELFGTGGETGIGGRGISNGNTGPIDHGDCGQGTQNVACAAVKFATGQLTIDQISQQYDAPLPKAEQERYDRCMVGSLKSNDPTAFMSCNDSRILNPLPAVPESCAQSENLVYRIMCEVFSPDPPPPGTVSMVVVVGPVGPNPIIGGLKNASTGLKGIFEGGSVQGKSIIGIRSGLLEDGFIQVLSKNKQGYLLTNALGEEVRVMARNGQWEIRIRNQFGNYLDSTGAVSAPKAAHGITVLSR